MFSSPGSFLPFVLPPIIASGALVLLILLLRRAWKRSQRETEAGGFKIRFHSDLRNKSLVAGSSRLRRAVGFFARTDRVESSCGEADISIAEREKMLIKRIAANPRDVEAYELLGQVYLVQGNFVDAKECYQQVLIFNPQHPTAIKKLDRIKKLIDEQKEME